MYVICCITTDLLIEPSETLDLSYFGLYKIIILIHGYSFFIPEISPLLTTALNPVSQLVGDLPPACHEPYQENIIVNLN